MLIVAYSGVIMGIWKIRISRSYDHPEVDRIYGVYKECIRCLSKIKFYLLQDGCMYELL